MVPISCDTALVGVYYISTTALQSVWPTFSSVAIYQLSMAAFAYSQIVTIMSREPYIRISVKLPNMYGLRD